MLQRHATTVSGPRIVECRLHRAECSSLPWWSLKVHVVHVVQVLPNPDARDPWDPWHHGTVHHRSLQASRCCDADTCHKTCHKTCQNTSEVLPRSFQVLDVPTLRFYDVLRLSTCTDVQTCTSWTWSLRLWSVGLRHSPIHSPGKRRSEALWSFVKLCEVKPP